MAKPIDNSPRLARRTVLAAAPAALAVAGGTSIARATESKPPASAAPLTDTAPRGGLMQTSPGNALFAVAETRTGKVLGIANAGIKEFKNIPYGAPTDGANRFMPPKKPAPWKGIRNGIGYGAISPQTPADLRADYAMMIQWDRHVGTGGMGEDVLSLNVWTPALADGGKRPVLVSFHGGGFTTGSGNFDGYDGAQLARFGNVVVVTVNHRLSAFGYINLVDAGAPGDFEYAGVAGIMDLTQSLEWVRDNIEEFGGDPTRVMIFGQSGGGAKTSVMLGNPAAKGLFHRAAVQSGSHLKLATREDSAKLADAFLKSLGIGKKNFGDIRKFAWPRLLEAQMAAMAANPGIQFEPVLDGKYLTHHSFDPTAPEESADVPVIVSTALEEAALRLVNFDLDEAGLKKIMAARYGDKGDQAIAMVRKAYPDKSPFLVQAQIFTDSGFRRSAITQAERKADLGKAPVYTYLWEWPSPGFNGKFGAVHGTDVSATFYNVRDPIVGVGSTEGTAMCKRLATTWCTFAATGDPNNSEVPHWPAYDSKTRATMVFNNTMRVDNDPRSEMRQFWNAMPPAKSPVG
jgi:para-nitrobenzyl esterase